MEEASFILMVAHMSHDVHDRLHSYHSSQKDLNHQNPGSYDLRAEALPPAAARALARPHGVSGASMDVGPSAEDLGNLKDLGNPEGSLKL